MDINDLVLSDEALNVIDKGEWVDAGYSAPGVQFLVCGMESEAAKKMIKDEQAKARQAARGKPVTAEQHSEITRKVLVEAVLKGWRGLESGGKTLNYSKDQARKFIMGRGGDKFTELVLRAAQRLDDTANEYVGEISKN